jgi:hypothetical protein
MSRRLIFDKFARPQPVIWPGIGQPNSANVAPRKPRTLANRRVSIEIRRSYPVGESPTWPKCSQQASSEPCGPRQQASEARVSEGAGRPIPKRALRDGAWVGKLVLIVGCLAGGLRLVVTLQKIHSTLHYSNSYPICLYFMNRNVDYWS